MFFPEPSKIYTQWQGNKMRIALPRAETEQYWRSIWEREAVHNTNASGSEI